MEAQKKLSLPIDLRLNTMIPLPQFIQNDTNVLEFTVKDNGVDADLSNITRIVVNYKRLDKKVISRLLTATGNKVLYKVGLEEMEVPGPGELELQFFENEKRISTKRFKVNMLASIGTDAIYETTEQMTVLQELFVEVDTVKEETEIARQNADAATEAAKTAAANAQKVANENKTRFLPAVATVADRNSAYPTPANGDTVRVTGESKTYRYDSVSGWVVTDQYNPTAIDKLNADLAEKATKTELTTTNNNVALKADKSYVDSNISSLDAKINSQASGSPKGTYATVADLQTAFPTGNNNTYVVTADGKWYYWNGSAWTAGGVYQSTGIADKSVTKAKAADDLISYIDKKSAIVVSTNMFDKTKVTNGYYFDMSGNQVASSVHSISDFIEVASGEKYIFKYAPYTGVFYTSAKVYISSTMDNPITVPTNAKYFRFGVANANLDTQQMNQGSTLLTYESYYRRLESGIVSNDSLANKTISTDKFTDDTLKFVRDKSGYLREIKKDISNPFKKTQIKLLGDSITYGAGGTGAADSANPVGSPAISGKFENVTTATNWANMLKTHIETKFNKDHLVETNNENITYTSTPTIVESGYAITPYLVRIPNTGAGKGFEFDFYGDHFSVYYTARNGGIADIYVDGVKVDTLDTYSATETYKQERKITGLALGQHHVEIRETGTKNASAGNYTLTFEGLLIPKTSIVKNWGINGATGSTFAAYKNALIENNDDIVFLQFGTNDRLFGTNASYTKAYLKEAIKYLQNRNKKVVLMSAPQATNNQENGTERKYGQEDVDNAISELADEYGMRYISNYNAYQDYMREKNLLIDSLLADSLHPNDLGYKVMYQNIMRNLGLPYLTDGMTYN